eukprot:GILJ01027085.1.p1 GENE.GILJ01027085.1~~GILJ01027085.1.p1  ORF type:complete len:306 (+),score=34.04 GILJ01027085.1:35-919(+)
MITIANSMQLPKRLDAKTRSRLNTTHRVIFPSYSASQLQNILEQRLDAAFSASGSPYQSMCLSAREYISRQVGLHIGDVRRLLQTSAAALQELLCAIEDFAEKVKAQGSSLSINEAVAAMEAFGIPTPSAAATEGVAQLRHLGAVARNVLHDRFQDFMTNVTSPYLYTIIVLIAKESIKLSAIARAENAERDTANIPVDRLHLLVKSTIEKYGPSEAPSVSFSQFLMRLETLRQVNFLELSVGANEDRLLDAVAALSSSEPVYLSIVQPPEDVLARCEVHDLYNSIGKHLVQIR